MPEEEYLDRPHPPIPLSLEPQHSAEDLVKRKKRGYGDENPDVVCFTFDDGVNAPRRIRCSAEDILLMERTLGRTIAAQGPHIKKMAQMESSREVFWHCIAESYQKLIDGKVSDALNLLEEVMTLGAPISPMLSGDLTDFSSRLTPLSVGTALAELGKWLRPAGDDPSPLAQAWLREYEETEGETEESKNRRYVTGEIGNTFRTVPDSCVEDPADENPRR